MSHFKERKEKNCLNCDAEVQGRYCQVCGQENVEPKETFGHLVTHFAYDITHFDGKFFSSLKYLLFKPGFLSLEYIRGKRASYLNPIKMYVFISAIFFLFFFTLMKPVYIGSKTENKQRTVEQVRGNIEKRIKRLEGELKEKESSEFEKELSKSQLVDLRQDLITLQKDTTNFQNLNYYKGGNITFSGRNYKSINYYDSIQVSLPEGKRDSWLTRIYERKKIELRTKFSGNGREFLEKLLDKFFHTFPQLFFVSLPIFALLLKLLYIRRKNFLYAEHVIYAVHLYCATFIFMFLLRALSIVEEVKYVGWLGFLMFPVSLYMIWYHYRSIKNFYKQGWFKTFLKFILLIIMSSMVLGILFGVFLVFSLFTI